MTNKNYLEILQKAAAYDTLYLLVSDFFEKSIAFYSDVVKLESFQNVYHKRSMQFVDNVDGRYNELHDCTKKLNQAFKNVNPPISALPESRGKLSDIVGDIIASLFNSRLKH